jgi:purine-binding chemotaxis protein CheW
MTTLPAESHPGARQARACVVALAGTRFAVEVRHAREVVVFDDLTMVPLAPPHLLGVVNLRGSVMALVDIRPFLGLEAARAERQPQALVVQSGGALAALLIDEVIGLEPLDGLARREEDADEAAGAFTAGRLERDGGAVTLLDVGRILQALGGPGEADREAR